MIRNRVRRIIGGYMNKNVSKFKFGSKKETLQKQNKKPSNYFLIFFSPLLLYWIITELRWQKIQTQKLKTILNTNFQSIYKIQINHRESNRQNIFTAYIYLKDRSRILLYQILNLDSFQQIISNTSQKSNHFPSIFFLHKYNDVTGLIPKIIFNSVIIAFILYPIFKSRSIFKSIFQVSAPKSYTTKNVQTTFKDVAGLQNSKNQVLQIVDFLKNPIKFQTLGAKIPRGALLTGPPGTGKTLLAKACAGQAHVPFLYISGSDFTEMFVGVGASRVRNLFKQAKQNSPSIIFIDEIDAVAKKRSSRGISNPERQNTLNQLLVEMDGFESNQNVIVLAATNREEVLDPAIKRPGRFDRIVPVDLPDIKSRIQIFIVHLAKYNIDPTYQKQQFIKRLASLTPGFSGADIATLCNQAAILAARENKQYVGKLQFEKATQRVIAGIQKKGIINKEQKKIVAYHQSGHAVVAWFLQGGDPLIKLTIVPRSKGSLGYAQYLPKEISLFKKQQLQDKICVILGGRISEQHFFQQITTGAADDLLKISKMCYEMVTKYGMSDLGLINLQDQQYYKNYSEQINIKVDQEVKKIIQRCSQRTRLIIKQHSQHIHQLATALIQRQRLDKNQIVQILGNRPFKNQQHDLILKQ